MAETESYFSHTRPDGTTCFSVLAEQDIFYRSVAENIAAGQSSAEQVINSWWNSPGHKQNMMNASLTHLGVGYSQDTNGYFRHYWVQLFVGGCQFESLSVKGGTDLSVKKAAPYPIWTCIWLQTVNGTETVMFRSVIKCAADTIKTRPENRL